VYTASLLRSPHVSPTLAVLVQTVTQQAPPQSVTVHNNESTTTTTTVHRTPPTPLTVVIQLTPPSVSYPPQPARDHTPTSDDKPFSYSPSFPYSKQEGSPSAARSPSHRPVAKRSFQNCHCDHSALSPPLPCSTSNLKALKRPRISMAPPPFWRGAGSVMEDVFIPPFVYDEEEYCEEHSAIQV
jgi:hypothetical protein